MHIIECYISIKWTCDSKDKFHKLKKKERESEKGLSTTWFYLYNVLEKAKIKGNKPDKWLSRARGCGMVWTEKGQWGPFWSNENIAHLDLW